MLSPQEQTPESVLARLSPVVPVFYEAFEASILNSNQFFTERDRPVDPFLFPNLVRYEAMHVLDRRVGPVVVQAVSDDPVGHLLREPLANNGLQLHYDSLSIRFWKSDEGDVPVAGHSHRRQEFYRQLLLFEHAVERLNLIVLWDVTPKGLLEDFMVACPRIGSARKGGNDLWWRVPLPHPGHGFGSAPRPSPAPRSPEPDDDLDNISLPAAKQHDAPEAG